MKVTKKQFEKEIIKRAADLGYEVNVYGNGSRYIEIEHPEKIDMYKIRISDHYAKNGAGFSMATGQEHAPADNNIVITKYEGKTYLDFNGKTCGFDIDMTPEQVMDVLINDIEDYILE